MKRLFASVALATAVLVGVTAAPAFAALESGVAAPDFSAQGMLGGKEFTFKLADALKTGPVVVYFFPAAFTPGCTLETQLFADAADEFKAAGATLIGVTGGARMADGKMAGASDNLARLAEFSKEHCRDKFPIAAVSGETIAKYNVVMPQRAELSDRTSYVIGSDGKIVFAHTTQKPDEHVTLTLKAVKDLKAPHAHTHN
ncbi:MAG: peroxiredoxin [Alphaproteobacteria bacterium]|nr:peroxiredoxin [Alphaproteobacteria bacterium]